MKELCEDKLTAAKISLFASVAAQYKPFLDKFQINAPLAPCFYNEIGQLLHALMKRFVKKLVMAKADAVAELLKIDVTNRGTRYNYKEVAVGVAANKELA